MTLDELAKHAVALPGWRWMPGMAAGGPGYNHTARIIDVDHGTPCLPDCWEYKGYIRGREHADDWWDGALPDFTDAATTGCLLALVREALGWPDAYACHDDSGWFVSSGVGPWETQDEASPNLYERYPAEIAALVAALEAAPVTP